MESEVKMDSEVKYLQNVIRCFSLMHPLGTIVYKLMTWWFRSSSEITLNIVLNTLATSIFDRLKFSFEPRPIERSLMIVYQVPHARLRTYSCFGCS